MIYILSSFDRNYVKYYKRFINCLASNFENNLGTDLGHRSVTLIGVPKGEFTNDEILDFYSFMENKGVQGKIIEVSQVPSRYEVLSEAYSMSTTELEESYFTFIDIDDEVEFNAPKFNPIYEPKDLYMMEVVTMYGSEVKPTPSYINLDPSSPYYTWGSLIWGRIYSSRVVSKALGMVNTQYAITILDYEYPLIFLLAYLSQIGAGVGKMSGNYYIWKRHEKSLTAEISPNLDLCSKIIKQVNSTKGLPKTAAIETAFTLLSNITSKNVDWKAKIDELCKRNKIVNDICYMKFPQFCQYWRGLSTRRKLYNFMSKRSDGCTITEGTEPRYSNYRRLIMVTTMYSKASNDDLELYLSNLKINFMEPILEGKVIPVVLYDTNKVSLIKRLLTNKDKESNLIISKIVFVKKSGQAPLRHEAIPFILSFMRDSDWLTFVDSDDTLKPEILELVNEEDPRGKPRMINFPVTRSDGDRPYLKNYLNSTYLDFVNVGLGVAIWGRLFSRSSLVSVKKYLSHIERDYHNGWGEELILMHALIKVSFEGSVSAWRGKDSLEEGVYVWRKTPGSLSSKVDLDSATENIKNSAFKVFEDERDAKNIASICAMRLGFALPLEGEKRRDFCIEIGTRLKGKLVELDNLSELEREVYSIIYNASIT